MLSFFDEVRRGVTAKDAARFYGMTFDPRGEKALCPFHDDHDPSLNFKRNGQYKCYVCGAYGSSIDLVAHKFGIAPIEAAKKLNDDFHLGVNHEQKEPTPGKRRQTETVYQYPNGLQKIRYTDKSFAWKCQDGKGGWTWGRGNLPHVLYIAGNVTETVFACEGEKDADNLYNKLGFPAVSGENGAGSGKWLKEYTEQLQGHAVYIFQDNDQVGKDYAQEIAAALYGGCTPVKVLDLSIVWPEIPEHGDVSDLIAKFGPDKSKELIADLIERTPDWTPPPPETNLASPVAIGRKVKPATSFGEDDTGFLWYPYLPTRDYTVILADGGTGKTIFCCGVAAAVSTGKLLPGEVFEGQGQNVLIISAEDSGELLKKRLALSGADLNRVFILDRGDSEGLNFSDGYDEFVATVKSCHPALVIIDPWHAFLGEGININRVNAVRPIFQKLANLAKSCDCAMILVSHVNKKAQGENANNAATGSTDFINAARSAARIIFDETDENCRIMVHTKSNYAPYGESVRYRIHDGGLEWDGFSDITKATLEAAARRRTTPWEVIQSTNERETTNAALIEAVEKVANSTTPIRFSYDEFKKMHGELIFGGQQPKRALDAIKDRVTEDGYYLKTGIQVRKNGKNANGFLIQGINTTEPEQIPLCT